MKIPIKLIPTISKISERRNEKKDLIPDSPLETGNLQNFEKSGDQLSLSEQLVTDEKETYGDTELGGGEDPSMREGSEIAQSGLIEFGNNLVGLENFPWGEWRKGCFSAIRFNGGK